MNGLIGNGEIFGGRMESGFMGNGLIRNKPSANVFESIKYRNADPYIDNVVLYLKGDGVNNSTTIVDSSPTPKAITRFGDVKISTAQSKYGGSSILFDGNGDYLSLPNNSDLSLGGSNFTFECWFNPTVASSHLFYWNVDTSTAYGGLRLSVFGTNQLQLLVSTNNGSWLVNISSSNNVYFLNTWNHCAVVRNENNITIYVNGISVITTTVTGSLMSGTTNILGALIFVINNFYTGYQDSIRLTKGVARYTANFNPETDTYLSY